MAVTPWMGSQTGVGGLRILQAGVSPGICISNRLLHGIAAAGRGQSPPTPESVPLHEIPHPVILHGWRPGSRG